MGKKSDKKLKAERVNALRKQYDAFLEEDKKRKERNEYILGKLDSIRYSTTAVQVRHKPIVIGDVIPAIPLPFHRGPAPVQRNEVQPVHPEYQINRPNHTNLQIDVPRTHVNTTLLREISKNYIMIPKLRSSPVGDYSVTIGPQSLPSITVSSPQPNNANNEDWKSKYEILDKLKKKEEKGRCDEYRGEEVFPVTENRSGQDTMNAGELQITETDMHYKTNSHNKIYQTHEPKYENEVPEKDFAPGRNETDSVSLYVENLKLLDGQNQEYNTDQVQLNKTQINPISNTDDYLPAAQIETLAAVEDNYEAKALPQPGYTNKEISDNILHNIHGLQQEHYSVRNERSIVAEGTYPEDGNAYLQSEDNSSIQVHDSTTVGHSEDTTVAHTKDTTAINGKGGETLEYPVEMINEQDFTPDANVELIDGVNVNPKPMMGEENVEPMYKNNLDTDSAQEITDPTTAHNTSEIEAFETEQKEMFYSEETGQYGYDQLQEETYNQDYNIPTQGDAYYESPAAMQEQEYPVTINEHEESNERYDQSYAEQYQQEVYQDREQPQYQPEGYDQTDQQYVQPEGYDQTNVQYEQQEGYDTSAQQYDQQYVQPEVYDQQYVQPEDNQQYVQPEDNQQYVQPEDNQHDGNQQYAEQVGYDQTNLQYEGYDYQQQEHDTVQNIEQVLDNEEGYVDQSNTENIAAPAQQAVDQTAT